MSRPIKIKLYADDASLFLRDFIDFREVLSRIKLFSIFSGLCLNRNKCSAMYIGDSSYKGIVKYGIKFHNSVKILGITFSNEKSTCDIRDNFEPRINKLEKICSLWERRHLSLIGKITILKTFGISQFIYIMQSIGICSSDLVRINRIMFRFIWNNKIENQNKVIERVKRTTVCSRYESGGLEMIDIVKMQDSFLLNWADRLLDNKVSAWKDIPYHCFEPVGGTTAFNSNVTGKSFKGIDLINSNFWKRVIYIWLEYKNKEFKPDYTTIKLSDPIFNNIHIQYRSKPLFIHSCIKRNMIFLYDFICDGSIISMERFIDRFGKTAETDLAYYLIFNALKRVEDHFAVEANCLYETAVEFLFKEISVGSISRKGYYELISNNATKPLSSQWVQNYRLESDAEAVWSLPHQCTSEVKLIVLQWKILHGIYASGYLLEKMNLRPSDSCIFCDGIRDTLVHFFFQCPTSQDVWIEAAKIISSKIGKIIVIREVDVMLGFLDAYQFGYEEMKYINSIGLVGKHTISKFKSEPIGKILILFEKELSLRDLS